jgi:hypothetical protein
MIPCRTHALHLSWYDGTAAPDGSLPPLPDDLSLATTWVWWPTPDTTSVPLEPPIAASPAPDAALFLSPLANAAVQPLLPAGTSQLVLSSLTAHDAIVLGSPTTTANTTLADDNSDIAMGANLARAMFGVDGTGISIGILSDSFNVTGGEAADIAAGNLPGANDLHILAEGPAGATDEGRAMAELVHQIAPGAQIYFYTGDNSETDFAAGIQALASAGCQVIVDDLAYFDEPFFQDGGAVQKAVETVVGDGIDYFTSAGNVANDFYEHSWISLSTTLPGVSGAVTAFDFGTAAGSATSPFETISIAAGGKCNLDLQWDQPFKTIGGSAGTVNSLSIYMFVDGSLLFSATTDATTVQIAVVDSVGPAPGFFKIIDQNDEGTWGAAFIDPNAGIGSGTVFGHALVPGANTVGAVNYADTPAFGASTPVLESFSSVGAGQFLFDANGNRLANPVATNKVDFTAPDGSATSVFDPFLGTSAAAPDAAAVAALMLQLNPHLTPAQVTSDLEAGALPMGDGPTADGAGFIQAVPALQAASAACYVAGTLILTNCGEHPIEHLQAGDKVLTLAGEMTVRWIGWRQLDLMRHPDPGVARPIRVRRNAIADGLPRRDLLVSPDHGLFIDGRLIPAKLLVNDGSIAVETSVRSVAYYHVELDRHAILFADGLSSESYLDTGNRCMFANAYGPAELHPMFVAVETKSRMRDGCVPLSHEAALVRPVWERLAARSHASGLPIRALTATHDARLRLALPDGRSVAPTVISSDHYLFVLPPGTAAIRIHSRASPANEIRPWIDDRRQLGVCVKRITAHGSAGNRDIPVDHPLVREGWWRPEGEGHHLCRWTDGNALLPLIEDAHLLELWLADAMAYPEDATEVASRAA